MSRAQAAMLSEIVSIYRASKKKIDINWWTEWVCRPIAAAVVYALKNTRITPNQVTFASLVVCAGSGAMFLFLQGYWWVLLATIALEFSFILDCTDGMLSRVRNSSSVLGHLLDFLMDEIKAMLFFGCVGVYLWRSTGDERMLLVTLGAMFCLASGIAITSFMRRPEYGAREPDEDGQPAVITRRQGVVGSFVTLLEHSARVLVHYPSYVVIVAAFGRIDIYFWAYAGVNVLYLGRSLLIIFWRLGRFPPTSNKPQPPSESESDPMSR